MDVAAPLGAFATEPAQGESRPPAWSGGVTWPVSLLLIACACLTLVAALAAPETARTQLA